VEKNTYSYEEAFESSLQYFKGDELAARVWINKYAVKDSFGNIYEKSPDDMFVSLISASPHGRDIRRGARARCQN